MKNTSPYSLILTILSLTLPLALSVRVFPNPPVIGLNGKVLKLGEPYYISSTIFPKSDGICLVDNSDCPDDVIQCPAYYDNPRGNPVKFVTLEKTEDTLVREDTLYNIEYSSGPTGGNCSNNGILWYVKDNEVPNKEFVAIGSENKAVQFKLQRVLLGYKIVYCTVIPIPPIPVCYGVGFVPQNGYNRLGAGQGVNPVEFFFTNATGSAPSSPGPAAGPAVYLATY